MDEYMIVMRIIHIVAGVFWVGSTMLFVLFLEPSAAELGPNGGPFMGHLANKKKLPTVLLVASVTTIVAGALLYWRTSSGLDMDWMKSGPGSGFTAGAIAAIVAWLIGFTILRPGMGRLAGMRQRLGSGDASVRADAESLQRRLRIAGLTNVSLLTLSVVLMASARYL